MAYPVVQTADTTNGVVASNSASWTLTYPSNIAAGDLIVGWAAVDGSVTGTWPANWIVDRLAGAAITLLVAKKLGLGSETGTFSLGLSASEQGGWRVFRITGWGGNLGANMSAGDCDWLSSAVGSPSANPNPPVLDPTDWGVEDTLWMAACAVDTSRTVSVYPLPDLNTADVSGGAGGATLGLCMDDLTQASLDPGTFTVSASDDWAAATLGVRPAAAVAAPPRYGFTNFQDPGVF